MRYIYIHIRDIYEKFKSKFIVDNFETDFKFMCVYCVSILIKT